MLKGRGSITPTLSRGDSVELGIDRLTATTIVTSGWAVGWGTDTCLYGQEAPDVTRRVLRTTCCHFIGSEPLVSRRRGLVPRHLRPFPFSRLDACPPASGAHPSDRGILSVTIVLGSAANKAAEGELERPSSAIESFPRDLLHRLSGNNFSSEQAEALGGESDEVELNLSLGLSLAGCFGVDPEGKKLVRSSSIASFSSLPREHDFFTVTPTLVRASSLPTESEEERRKRKESQGLRRLEAKRKRLEKRSSIKSGALKDEGGKSLAAAMSVDGRLTLPIGTQFSGVFDVVIPPRPPAWAAGPNSTVAQGSVGSQGSSSFSVSEVESQTPARGEEDPLKKVADATTDASLGRNTMEDMPCVSTRGDGPNGRRIEGLLYRYKKGEDVRIVCVCHGSFLTPAEFVKHAGGGDVAHPLRHIVVNPSPPALL
ncbi:ninja-family protein AFP3-like [Musa acuminata AAA Group]|uniref:ninja-family protein AFP3-like n=1 Tax=Musa acuminata AAA Group TaxID=214697 RepID=UPI0031CDE0D1